MSLAVRCRHGEGRRQPESVRGDDAGHRLGPAAINYHGIAHTHLDSLAHINENGVFYNGYKPDPEAVARDRHAKNSIHNVKNGIFTRGVLIDIPRLKGVPYLEPGTPIYVEDLEAWEKQAGREGVGRATRCSFAPACGRGARLKGRGCAGGRRAADRPGSIRR